jgi:ketosteroid isomerase-like protein
MEARGTVGIRKYYTDWFAAMTITEAKIDSTYTTSGDLSLGYGTGTVIMQPKAGGAPQTVTVRITAVAKKVDGKWQYFADHGSAPLPQQPRSSK